MSFLELPLEIQSSIASHLDLRSLASFGMVSRDCNKAMKSVLEDFFTEINSEEMSKNLPARSIQKLIAGGLENLIERIIHFIRQIFRKCWIFDLPKPTSLHELSCIAKEIDLKEDESLCHFVQSMRAKFEDGNQDLFCNLKNAAGPIDSKDAASIRAWFERNKELFKNITRLFVEKHSSKVREIPEEVASLTGLTYLEVARVGLRDASVACRLAKLSSLVLQQNELTSLPDTLLENLTGLKDLDIHGNRLNSIPPLRPGLHVNLSGKWEVIS